jgi:hypothetical protein
VRALRGRIHRSARCVNASNRVHETDVSPLTGPVQNLSATSFVERGSQRCTQTTLDVVSALNA